MVRWLVMPSAPPPGKPTGRDRLHPELSRASCKATSTCFHRAPAGAAIATRSVCCELRRCAPAQGLDRLTDPVSQRRCSRLCNSASVQPRPPGAPPRSPQSRRDLLRSARRKPDCAPCAPLAKTRVTPRGPPGTLICWLLSRFSDVIVPGNGNGSGNNLAWP
jgi:hypothetical protein